jgi:hypothetical protein
MYPGKLLPQFSEYAALKTEVAVPHTDGIYPPVYTVTLTVTGVRIANLEYFDTSNIAASLTEVTTSHSLWKDRVNITIQR